MDYRKRWNIISELGAGGQGKVYRVLNVSKFNVENNISPAIQNAIQRFTSIQDEETIRAHFESFRKAIVDIISMENPNNHGALKVLHEPQDARDYERAEERIKREITAMSEVSHSSLLKILDHDPDAKWYVSEFHPKGTLINNKDQFTGDWIGSLRAFRHLVEGVSELHKKGFVHRDIKPHNVFLDSNDSLVLGDFGLVFFTDDEHTRISDTWENVGSHDWMPAWAMAMKIEEVKPTFDVFSLGKLLWAMVSNKPALQLWYFNRDKFNLEKMFPDAPSIKLANGLFSKCIVENEEDCIPDATILLKVIDQFLSMIDRNADLIIDNERLCKACGIGHYRIIADRNRSGIVNVGLNPTGAGTFKIFSCDHCGHVELFYIHNPSKPPPMWKE